MITRTVACLAIVAASSACVGPSRTNGDYALKATSTAEELAGIATSVRLSLDLVAGGKGTAAYLTVLLEESERDAQSVLSAFDGVQPPSSEADALRTQLDDLAQPLLEALTDLRTTVRRGYLRNLAAIAGPLPSVAKGLTEYADEHTHRDMP